MRAQMRKSRDLWLLASAGTAFFAAVYECFSHQVYSKAMILAFLFPLLGGLLPAQLLLLGDERLLPGEWSRSLWGVGIASLTLGSIFRGVLEIYGTTSRLSPVYSLLGAALLAAGLFGWAIELRRRGRAQPGPCDV